MITREPGRAGDVIGKEALTDPDGVTRASPRPRVLVVDDDVNVLHGIRRLLRKRFDVTIVDSPIEAVRRLEVDQEFAVIVSDHNMPMMTGTEFLALAILLAPDAVRVMLTGSADPLTAVEAINVGRVFRYISKPFGAEDLHATLDAAVVEYESAALDRNELRRLRELREAEAEVTAERRTEIERAISGGMCTVFQPIVRLEQGLVSGHEALSRFAGGSDRTPDRWFDEAAVLGMGVDLDAAAIRVALDSWQAERPADQSLWLNVSPATVVSGDVTRELLAAPHPLVIEITERVPVEDYGRLRQALEPLRAQGILLAIDDVGAGYSSLRHVTELRPDVVKIDRSIIADIDADDHRQSLLSSLISFANASGVTTLGEGVENVAESRVLARLGAELVQGYHFGRPGAVPRVGCAGNVTPSGNG